MYNAKLNEMKAKKATPEAIRDFKDIGNTAEILALKEELIASEARAALKIYSESIGEIMKRLYCECKLYFEMENVSPK